MEEFPSNSRNRRKAVDKKEPEPKEVKRVTTASVNRRKKPVGRKLTEFFTGSSDVGVFEHVLFEILQPAIKDMVAEAVSSGVERRLFGPDHRSRGRGRGSSLRGGGGGGWTSYRGDSNSRDAPRMSHRGRAQHNFDELICDTRADADEVLRGLDDLIQEFEVATVQDLYDLCGETASHTDNRYGWTDLGNAGVRRAGREGYLVVLPRPELLN